MRSLVKRTLTLFSIAGAFAGCGFFGSQEQVRQEPGRTTYRVPEDNSLERPDITSVQEKVPGEIPLSPSRTGIEHAGMPIEFEFTARSQMY